MIRILLADDHTILRSGLRRLIAPQTDMEIVAEAADAREAISAVAEFSPDVAVIDLDMPQGGGVWAISVRPRCRIAGLVDPVRPTISRLWLGA